MHGEHLEQSELPENANIGLAHTRWSTHGKPSLKNAHPINAGPYHVVHNGIIENYQEIFDSLGISPSTDTDSESIAWLLFKDKSLHKTVKSLRGQYAFCAISEIVPDYIMFAVKGSPLYLSNNGFIASEIDALAGYSEWAMKIPDGTYGILTKSYCEIRKIENKELIKNEYNLKVTTNIQQNLFSDTKMHSEIIEQAYLDYNTPIPKLENKERIVLFGCGSSYNAALLGRFYFEKISNLPCCVEYASAIVDHVLFDRDKTHYIALSQSGETKDTILAMEYIGNNYLSCITNNVNSACASMAKNVIPLNCNKEVSVAATKTFTMQCVKLLQIATKEYVGNEFCNKLREFINNWDGKIKNISRLFKMNNALYLATGEMYAVARESALKMKEVAYVHAEAIQAAEMKHGPIALIDGNTLTVFLVADDANIDKITANMHEINSRSGKMILIITETIKSRFDNFKCPKILVPKISWYLQPLLHNVAGQLLAYYVAKQRGLNTDEPRNLAKTCTV